MTLKKIFFSLLAAVFLASFVHAGYVQKTNVTMKIASQAMWTSTGVVLEEGDELVIRTQGLWAYDPRPQYASDANGIFKGGPGSMRGIIGGGKPFFIGSSYIGAVNEKGALSLGMAECDYPSCYRDNYGEMIVNIVVNGNEKQKTIEQNKPASQKTFINDTAFNVAPQNASGNAPQTIVEAETKTCPSIAAIGIIALAVLFFMPKESSSK